MIKSVYPLFKFSEARSIVVSGDIHGDFNLLVNKMCVQYEMRDTLLIVAGDCGFGFDKKGFYENMVRRNAKRMNDANIWILFVRGNHDNPAYFDGKEFCHKRFMAVPDYSVVVANGHTILCVRGAVSIDRQHRISSLDFKQAKGSKYSYQFLEDDLLSPNYYWINESPLFDDALLFKILEERRIDTIITHTAPSFCELQNKAGLS